MKKFFIKSLLFLILICLIIQLSGMLIKILATHSSQVKPFWALNKKNQEYQTAFIGSSRVYYTLDAKEAEKYFGGKSINLGSSGATFIDNYLTIYLMLKKNNIKIKNLFLQVDERSLNSENHFAGPFGSYIFYNYISDPEVAKIFIDKVGKEKYFLYKYFPPSMYIEYNNPYKAAALGFFRSKYNYNETRGSEFKDGVTQFGAADIENLKKIDMSVSRDGEYYLQKIIELAQKEGVNVILYTAPNYSPTKEDSLWFSQLEKYIKIQAEKYNVPYLNFSYSSLSNNVDYFYKYGHLNRSGVAEFMKIFLPEAKKYLK